MQLKSARELRPSQIDWRVINLALQYDHSTDISVAAASHNESKHGKLDLND